VATRVLVGDQHPDHTVISEFRRTQAERRLQKEIDALLAEAEAADRAEDRLYGKDRRGDELPEELRRRETRLERIRQAKAELEAEAAAARAEQLEARAEGREDAIDEDDDLPPTDGRKLSRQERRRLERLAKKSRKAAEKARAKADRSSDVSRRTVLPQGAAPTDLVLHRTKFDRHGDPTEKAQRNFTDPDSRIMVMGGGAFEQAYNCQAMVTDEQIIVATDVSNQAPDTQQMVPMLLQTEANCGALPDVFLADNGYFSGANVEYCEAAGVEAYISVGRKRWEDSPPQESVDRPPLVRMYDRLRTVSGREHYARREVMPEPVFGQIKHPMGFAPFSLRGLRKVRRGMEPRRALSQPAQALPSRGIRDSSPTLSSWGPPSGPNRDSRPIHHPRLRPSEPSAVARTSSRRRDRRAQSPTFN